MPNLFSRTRCVELSLVKYIKDQITANWTGVSVVKSFTEAYDTKAPVICVRMISSDIERWEVGSSRIKQENMFTIDIFGSSDGNRIDLEDFIINKIKEGFVYYDCAKNGSNPEQIDYTANGRVTFLRVISDNRIQFNFDDDPQDKFRQSITFTVCKYD